MSATRETKREQGWLQPAVEVAKGSALALGSAVAVLAAAAGLMAAGLLGRGLEGGCVIVACLVGVLVGGLYANKRVGRMRLLVGVGTAAASLLVFLTMGLLWPDGVAGVGEMGPVLLGCLLGGLLSGLLPAMGGKRKTRKRGFDYRC